MAMVCAPHSCRAHPLPCPTCLRLLAPYSTSPRALARASVWRHQWTSSCQTLTPWACPSMISSWARPAEHADLPMDKGTREVGSRGGLQLCRVRLLTATVWPRGLPQYSALACSYAGQAVSQLMLSWACLPIPKDPGRVAPCWPGQECTSHYRSGHLSQHVASCFLICLEARLGCATSN